MELSARIIVSTSSVAARWTLSQSHWHPATHFKWASTETFLTSREKNRNGVLVSLWGWIGVSLLPLVSHKQPLPLTPGMVTSPPSPHSLPDGLPGLHIHLPDSGHDGCLLVREREETGTPPAPCHPYREQREQAGITETRVTPDRNYQDIIIMLTSG